MRKQVEQRNEGSRRVVTVIEDPELERDFAAEAAAGTEEAFTSHHSPLDVARGWVRTLAVWTALVLAAVEALLAFRLAFALGGANPASSFVDFIYDTSGPLVSPFDGILARRSAGGGGFFEPETLIAMAVYLVAAALVIGLVWAATAGPSLTGDRAVVTRSRRSQTVRGR